MKAPRGPHRTISVNRLARLLGDANAVEKHKVPRRVERRIAGKFTGRMLGKLFR